MALLALVVAGVGAAHGVTFEVADQAEFDKIIAPGTQLTTHATINSWLEGPTWVPSASVDGGYLVFCDQVNDRLKKLVLPSTLSDFFVPPPKTYFNGTLLDNQERLICAEAGIAAQRVTVLANGVATPLVTSCNGLKFYSPNDIAIKSDGTIWFTDPNYNSGAVKGSAGYPAGYYIYRFDPANGNASCVPVMTNNLTRATGTARPNGLCFSPDESRLYVADSDNSTDGNRLYVYTVTAANTLTDGKLFAAINNGGPDGIKCDKDGRVWSSAGNGVHVFAPDGHVIARVIFNRAGNLCFGGPQYQTLFIVAQPYVFSMPVLTAGPQVLKKLAIKAQNGQATVSWPAPSTGWSLQESQNLGSAVPWVASSRPVVTSGGVKTVTLDAAAASTYFRLRLDYAAGAASQGLTVGKKAVVVPKSEVRTTVVAGAKPAKGRLEVSGTAR